VGVEESPSEKDIVHEDLKLVSAGVGKGERGKGKKEVR
jgi:hypothetical protein